MERPPHDYAAFPQQQQQQFGFHPQHQQFPPPQFMPHHPSMQQFPYPPPPHFQQHPHQQQHPPPFPPQPHLPPHLYPPSPFHDSPPPSDPELQKRIDKLVEYTAKNGPEFELMIRQKQQDNPAYSFLFGGEGHSYYHYKLWLSTHPQPGFPFNPPFPPSSLHPLINPAVATSSSIMGAPPVHQPPFPPYYDPHHQLSHPFAPHARPDFDPKSFKGLSGPLPPDIGMELNNVLNSLNGTKDSIKGAKTWFMQRSPFAPALAEALRDRVLTVDDAERQLHVIYLANDILFDSLQRRVNPHELDNEALAFKSVIGPMLVRVYHNPQNQDENQPRLQKILQYWASNGVYDQDTIYALEREMVGGPPANLFPGPRKDLSTASDSLATGGFAQQPASYITPVWQPDGQSALDHVHPDNQRPLAMPPSLGNQQFIPSSVPAGIFPGSIPIGSSVLPIGQQPAPHSLQAPSTNVGEKLPPYPLFPPGLIPGMVRKMQIGSGVPYSPLSPLDIPTVIPPSNVSPSEILDRVSKYFKEIGEVNPIEESLNSHLEDEDDEYERDPPVRKGGACIPPPPNLQVDPETGTCADGSFERKPGSTSSGRLGLGAAADPNEASQYDDVYTSYRKQRSTNYHTSMSAKAATK